LNSEELATRELNQIMLLSFMPAIMVGLAIFFLYMNPVRQSMSDEAFDKIVINFASTLILWFVPIFLGVFAFTFEILYHMKIQKPFIFHLKRFIGRVTLSLIGASLLSATIIILNIALSSFVSIANILRISLLTFSVILLILVLKAKSFFRRLDKGEW
jgi:hypothetical protein